MEGKPSPHLKKVLKSYQLTAANTLNGPSSVLSRLDNASSSSSQSSASLISNSSSNSSNRENRDNEICNGGGPAGNVTIGEKGGIGSVSIKYENQDFRESCSTKDRHKNHFISNNQQQIVLLHTHQQNRQSQHQSPVYVRSISLNNNNACSPVSSGSGRLSSGSSTSGSNTCSPVGNFNINISNNVNSNVLGELARNIVKNGDGIGVSDNSVTISRQLNPKFNSNNPPALPPPPILSTPDRSRTEKRETLLEGEYISCFVVGGEKRLCFPQILTTVLRPFSLPQINQVCDELQIFCSRCSAEQLDVLKVSGVIPMSAHSCGLITKTDGERLVNSLLHRNPPKAAVAPAGRSLDRGAKNHFRVYHKCFGIGVGTVMPNLYERADSLCIECVECHGLFSPTRFVAHAHHRPENRTCHWGFDSANWRHYLHLSNDQEESLRWEKALEDFKARFDHKRKADTGKCDDKIIDEVQSYYPTRKHINHSNDTCYINHHE